jgi:type I restriction enzyme S subunit
MPDMPPGWTLGPIGDFTQQENARAGQKASVVLSSTKHRGLVPSVEFFKNRQIFSNDTSDYRLVRRGWFAYATNHLSEGSIGLQESYDEACVSPIYTVFSCAESVDPRYFFRVLKSPDLIRAYSLHEQASVDRRGAVRYRDFAKIQVAVPSLPEQRKIVEILDTMDESIRSTERLIAKLHLIEAGLFNRLLNSPDSRTWPGGPVEDWGEVKLGRQRSPSTESGTGMTPYLRVANVFDGRIDYSDVFSMNFRTAERKNFLIKKGDILLNEGQSLELVGRCAIYNGPDDTYCFQNTLVRYRCGPRLLPEFAYLTFTWWLKTRRFMQVAKQTTSIAHLGADRFAKMQLAAPPTEMQQQICNIFAAHRTQRSAASAELAKLQRIKDGLAADLLGGHVRVSVE